MIDYEEHMVRMIDFFILLLTRYSENFVINVVKDKEEKRNFPMTLNGEIELIMSRIVEFG